MQTSPKRNVIIVFAGLLLLLIFVFRQGGGNTTSAAQTITFVSPLPVTPVVETHTLTLTSALPPLITPTTLTPTLPHDLLLVNEMGLMRWRHGERRLEPIIATKVITSTPTQEPWHTVQYKISQDQRQVLVAYGMGILGEGGTFNLALYEPATAHLTTLMTTTHAISDFMLAPDGSWAAYLLRDVSPKRSWWRKLFSRNVCGCEEIYLATVYLLRLQPPYTPQPLQVCGRAGNGMGECAGLRPALSDQTQLAWLDGEGYWTADVATGTVQFLAERSQPAVALLDPPFGAAPSFATPYVISWLGEWPALTFALFNRQSWTVTKLPTRDYAAHTTTLHFLAPDQLLWLKAAGRTIERWRLDPRQIGTPVERVIWQLPLALRAYAVDTTLLDEERVGISVEGPATMGQAVTGLYWVDLASGELIKGNQLPSPPTHPEATLARAVVWSPDGRGALYLRETMSADQLEAIYIPAGGSPLVELKGLLGQQPEQITWLLDGPRLAN